VSTEICQVNNDPTQGSAAGISRSEPLAS